MDSGSITPRRADATIATPRTPTGASSDDTALCARLVSLLRGVRDTHQAWIDSTERAFLAWEADAHAAYAASAAEGLDAPGSGARFFFFFFFFFFFYVFDFVVAPLPLLSCLRLQIGVDVMIRLI
jgi:hypothetical protein